VTLPSQAISIRQPWAWLIVNAGKDIENRDWFTRIRGPVCIHAAKGMTRGEYDEARYFASRISPAEMPSYGAMTRGGIVGVAEIVDCVNRSASPWFFGRWGFVLRNVRPVDFIPVKGELGFFNWRKNVTEPA
jgi:hypothetical protein